MTSDVVAPTSEVTPTKTAGLPLTDDEWRCVASERSLLRLAGEAEVVAHVLALRNVLRRNRAISECDDVLEVLAQSALPDGLVVGVAFASNCPPVLTAARLRHSSGWSWRRIDDALRTAGLDLATRRRAVNQ